MHAHGVAADLGDILVREGDLVAAVARADEVGEVSLLLSSGTWSMTSFIAMMALCSEFILLRMVVLATILPVSSRITALV